jgi:hypothetical protein
MENSADTPSSPLLGELESIRSLLDDKQLEDIPVLSDIVDQSSELESPASNTFDVGQLFERFTASKGQTNPVVDQHASPSLKHDEEQNDLFPALENLLDKSCPDSASEPVAIEPLIQAIIDEAIPAFEKQLRERLSTAAPDIIRQLAKQYTPQ